MTLASAWGGCLHDLGLVRAPLFQARVASNLFGMPSKRSPALISALVLALAIAGCGQSDEEKATEKACTARDDIGKQVKELQGLTAKTATTSQVKESLTTIRHDLSTIADAQGDLSEDRRAELEAATKQFGASVRETAAGFGTTISAEDASAQLKTAFDGLAKSYQSTVGKIDCS